MHVLRGLGFEQLPCGCLAGIYETYGGNVVTILDVRAAACAENGHRVDMVLRRRQPGLARRPGLVFEISHPSRLARRGS